MIIGQTFKYSLCCEFKFAQFSLYIISVYQSTHKYAIEDDITFKAILSFDGPKKITRALIFLSFSTKQNIRILELQKHEAALEILHPWHGALKHELLCPLPCKTKLDQIWVNAAKK